MYPNDFILDAVYNDRRIVLILLGQDGQAVNERLGIERELP